MNRKSHIKRETKETKIELIFDMDGAGNYEVNTGVPFLDHMLALFAKHGLFDLTLQAKGDLEVDIHHTVEDVGICLGEGILQALGDKVGIKRYGSAIVPMDEALVMVAIDLGGRSYLGFDVVLKKRRIKEFDTELVEEFFRAVAFNAQMNLHIKELAGKNTHHIIEAIFKAFGVALDEATRIDERIKGVPSTKGKL